MKKVNLLGKIISKEVLTQKMLRNIKAGDGYTPPPKRPNFPSPPPSIRVDDMCEMNAYCLSYAIVQPEIDYCNIYFPCSGGGGGIGRGDE